MKRAASWRHDPTKGGPSLVLGDIGTHAHNLLRFITGLEVADRFLFGSGMDYKGYWRNAPGIYALKGH